MTLIQIAEEELTALKDSLRRCPVGTLEAAIAYRTLGDAKQIPKVVNGIIERYLEPEFRPLLKNAKSNLNLAEDLGIDSLTMMEIVLLVEEILKISFENHDLKELRTLGDIQQFMNHKIYGTPPPADDGYLSFEQIATLMPHRPPFLFLNSAYVLDNSAKGNYQIEGSEHFLEGHFEDNPVFPASILLEALGQLAVLLLVSGKPSALERKVSPNKIFFTSCDGVRCHTFCRPGDLLEMQIKVKRIRHPMATFSGSIHVQEKRAVFAEEITLIFDYTKPA